MVSAPFHHGARVFQSGEEPVLTSPGDTSIVQLVATAPNVNDPWSLDGVHLAFAMCIDARSIFWISRIWRDNNPPDMDPVLLTSR